eukprot:scaffold34616_cov159-Skeletonema_dohrnii-CCMP3373.AAC.8
MDEKMNTSNAGDQEAQNLLVKKRKTNPNDEDQGDGILSFLLASDLTLLTDYFILLFSQVTRGVMNETDLARAKKSRPCNVVGFFGIQCKHCGGIDRGKYFPSCAKNLCATPPTLHSHLLICPNVPETIKRALKLTKSRHKFAAMSKPSGSQSAFFNNMWERIQSPLFTGDDANGLATIQTEIDFIIEQSQPRPKIDPKVQRAMQIARQHEHEASTMLAGDPTQVELPNVVSYDLDNEYNYAYAAQALDVELKETTVEPPTEEDFELVLDLLRQPETPPENHPANFLQSPDMAFAMTPIAVTGPGVLSPIPTRVNEFGEQYVNGEFVISPRYDATNFCQEKQEEEEQEQQFSSPKPNDAGRTRKFTRNDEILLVRGILKHGKSSWIKIWKETPALQKIKHSALKDRARSKRFCSILERARQDPTLLNYPQELCGDENSPAYHSPKSATPRARNGKHSTLNTTSAEPLSAYGPLHSVPNPLLRR